MFHIIREESYQDGEIIFKEGESADEVYRVLSGAVVVTKEVGGRSLTIEVLREGEIFGEMAFITDMPRSASARALGATRVGVLDSQKLEDELSTVSQDLYQLFECLTLRLKKTTDAVAGVSLVRKEPRVSKTWFLMYEHGDMHLEAYSHNASCGGLYIKTPTPLARGERFSLNLHLPGDSQDDMKITCEVAWTRKRTDDHENFPLGMGVKFLDLAQDQYERLKRALEQGE